MDSGHSSSSSSSPFLLLPFFVFWVLLNIPPSFCANSSYTSCSNQFNCGKISVGYPFWGNNRPEGCGYPELKLNCINEIATLEIRNLTYRVLEVKSDSEILRISREDFMDDLCLTNFVDTALDDALFEYINGYGNITLVYGCLPSYVPIPGKFTCLIDGVLYDGYTELGNFPLGKCKATVSVPISETHFGDILSSSKVGEAIREGFEVKWKVDSAGCRDCTNSRGVCGFDGSLNQTNCFCQSQSLGSKICSSSPDATVEVPATPGKQNKLPLTLGLALAGAGVAGVFLGIWIFVCLQKRKKKVTAQLKTKDLSTIVSTTVPSSNGPTDTENFSRSTPSYPTSKSDLGKGSTYFGVHVFSYTELEEATDNFNPSRELGDGGFGTVYYGKLQDGRVVAVKRLYENSFKRVEQFMNEVEILTRLQHVNLVKLYGCTSKRSRELLLVYEYIPNGTVADHLHGNKSNSGLLTWPVRLSIALETADALAYLHRGDIIHRDVKTNNILLDSNFHVKVADFGLSRLFPTDVTHVSTAPQGTPGYVDPEYYQCYQLTSKSDVYSFGVVLMELISSMQAVDTNRHRHDINLASMAVNKIQNHTLQELVDPSLGFETDNAVRRMVTLVAELAFRCLQQERDMRPSMEEALATLRGIQSEEVDSQKAEVVDIRADDVGLLRALPPPDFSPDSVKWASDSTVPHSF